MIRTLPAMEVLDATDPAARTAYEQAFHAAFARVPSNRLVRKLWQWDEAQRRVATRVPYGDQRIYVQRAGDGRVVCAIAANLALRQLQSSAFGFAPPPDRAGCCELLAFFAVDGALGARLRFWEACFGDLRAQGLHTAYASTAARPLAIYRRTGGEVVGQALVEGEERYFLRFSLARHWMRRQAAGHRVEWTGSERSAVW